MPSDECTRIIGLPRIDYMDTNRFPDLSDVLMRKDGDWWKAGKRIFPHQNAVIYAVKERQLEFERTGKWAVGAAGIIRVGGGKTLVALLSASVLGKKKLVYITRAKLKNQVRDETYSDYVPNFDITAHVDVHSYSELSAQDASSGGKYRGGKLFQWCTEGVEHAGEVLIVLDEVHRLANPSAARTQRFLWDFLTLIAQQDPSRRPALLILTGSAVRTEVADMAHMFYMALAGNSPLPICIPTKHPILPIDNVVHECMRGWSNWLDKGATGGAQGTSDMNALADAFGEPGDAEPELSFDTFEEMMSSDSDAPRFTEQIRLYRKALQRRIASAPGVVMPPHDPDSGTRANILIHQIGEDELELPKVCRVWLDDYKAGRIDEDIYVCAEENGESRINKTLALGFVNRWLWPDSMDEADRHEWRVARSEWGKFLRAELDENIRPGYDTEKKVRDYLLWQIQNTPNETDGAHQILQRWMDAVRRWGRHIPTEAEWVDEFLIDDIMGRVDSAETPLLVWYRSTGLMEKLNERGLHVWHTRYNDPNAKRDAGKSIALSANSHTEGLNLQYGWNNNLIVELPGSAITQQLMGRTHRTGQEADFVHYSIYTHSAELRKVLRSVKHSAERDFDLTGDPQKILIGKEF